MIVRKSERELRTMGRAGEVVAAVLELIGESIQPGLTTGDLDEIAEQEIRRRGGVPTFKGYKGFPGSICASPNDMVVHGIPGPYRLEDGDTISVDVGVTLDGFVADSAYTFAVGDVDAEARRLLEACRAALEAGIAEARVGQRIGDISAAVQRVTEQAGFAVVKTLVGHGVGRSMHEEPQIPNYGEPGRGPELAEGMTLAIEPMINAGTEEVRLAEDGWSISTADGSRSAHFEHTVAVTGDGPRILTFSERLARRRPVGSRGLSENPGALGTRA
jgi:methionyl aminopeptidase